MTSLSNFVKGQYIYIICMFFFKYFNTDEIFMVKEDCCNLIWSRKSKKLSFPKDDSRMTCVYT